MNLFKAEGVKDYAAAASQIPVIDYGPYFAGEPGALDRLVPQVRHACENVGFFYIAGSSISPATASPKTSSTMPLRRRAASTRCRWTTSSNCGSTSGISAICR